jgi:hypothetical protein
MHGATEYYNLFDRKSQQIGRLFLQLHSHARGKCFQIILLPDGVEIEGDYAIGTKDSVEVYGVTGGQPGWTEEYGWLHKGQWQDDFYQIVEQKRIEKKASEKQHTEKMKATEIEKKEKTDKLLSSYA